MVRSVHLPLQSSQKVHPSQARFGASDTLILTALNSLEKQQVLQPHEAELLKTDVYDLLEKREQAIKDDTPTVEKNNYARNLMDTLRRHPSNWMRWVSAKLLEEESLTSRKKQVQDLLALEYHQPGTDSRVNQFHANEAQLSQRVAKYLPQLEERLDKFLDYQQKHSSADDTAYKDKAEGWLEPLGVFDGLPLLLTDKATDQVLWETQWYEKTFVPAMQYAVLQEKNDKIFAHLVHTADTKLPYAPWLAEKLMETV